MKIALISDTHGMLPWKDSLPECDVILHSGDICPDGLARQKDWLFSNFYPWVESLEKPFFATWGNHDFVGEVIGGGHLGPENLYIGIDELRGIGNLNVWFSPWSPRLPRWAWTADESILDEKYAKIPEETNIIVSHAPPHGACDLLAPMYAIGSDGDRRAGSTALRWHIKRLPNLRLVVCGHIHEGYGTGMVGSVPVHNVAMVDENYEPRFKPWTIVEIT